MNRKQMTRLEMFARVRNFGAASRELFPESSMVGQLLKALAEVVATIEHELVAVTDAVIQSGKVKAATRQAVLDGLKVIAETGRKAVEKEGGPNPFRLPGGRSAIALLTAARHFQAEADQRRDRFGELGLSETFFTTFRGAVDELGRAVGAQQDSWAARRRAKASLNAAFARGYTIVRELDVTLVNLIRADAVRLEEWRGARQVRGDGASVRSPKPEPVSAAPAEVATGESVS